MSKKKNFSRSDYIQALCSGEVWAVSPEWARTLANWANLEHFDPQALVTQAGSDFGTGLSRTSVKDGVGIMQVRGPMFTHENFMTWLFGFDTYESLAKDFQNLVNDSNVRGIVMNFHSPGGLTAGVDDLASMIYDARGTKPLGIVSRAGGDMASAAYWLGSSAEAVHVAPTGIVGSIGTVVQFTQDEPGTVTLVSDQSPNKRPDPNSTEGQAQVKALLNSLSDVFISRVARNRGVSTDRVLSDFGHGGVKVGQVAVDSGMADRVTTFDSTFSAVRNKQQETTMSTPNAQAPAPVQNPQAQAPVAPAPVAAPAAPVATAPAAPSASDVAVQAERDRVSGILSAFEGTTFASDAMEFISGGKSVAEAQAHALTQMKANASAAPAKPAAVGPTPAQLAAEAAPATAAAQSIPQPTAADSAKAVVAAMTAGANDYRRNFGGNSAKSTTK